MSDQTEIDFGDEPEPEEPKPAAKPAKLIKPIVFTTGAKGRDDGMKRAIDHADAVIEDWGVRAMNILLIYVGAMASGDHTICEDIRQYAEIRGLPNPPDKRAWGSVMTCASRRKVLRSVGYAKARDPKVHCTPTTLWEKL